MAPVQRAGQGDRARGCGALLERCACVAIHWAGAAGDHDTLCSGDPRRPLWKRAGVAPGNDESAGKQRSGKTRKGHRPLRAILTQLAHAAVRTKDTYLSLYQRLAVRRGKKRAIIAVAHSIMRSVFHMLSRNEGYRELGGNSFDERRRQFTVDRLTRRIEHLGYRVHLEPVTASAA